MNSLQNTCVLNTFLLVSGCTSSVVYPKHSWLVSFAKQAAMFTPQTTKPVL